MFDIPTKYCEQLLQLGWEPINTTTNLAFIFAGLMAFYALRKQQGVIKFVLPTLLTLIGLGSGWWHVGHTHSGDIADTLSILLFASVVGVLLLKKIFQSWAIVIPAFVVLLVVTLFAEQLPYFNGSLPYIVLLIGFIIGGIFYTKKFPESRTLIITAALTFILAIIFRSIDMVVCSELVIGTHFLWHILVATFGYQLIMLTAKE